METESHKFPARNTGPSRARRKASKACPAHSGYGDLPKYQASLCAVPESRPDAVARARALIEDPGFPSDEEQEIMAQYFARQLSSSSESLPN